MKKGHESVPRASTQVAHGAFPLQTTGRRSTTMQVTLTRQLVRDSERRSHLDARHDRIFRGVLKCCALLVLAALLGAALSTLWGGREVLFGQGLHFLTSAAWNPVKDDYGALKVVGHVKPKSHISYMESKKYA